MKKWNLHEYSFLIIKKLTMVICVILLIVVVGILDAFTNLILESTKRQVITGGLVSLELEEDEDNLTKD